MSTYDSFLTTFDEFGNVNVYNRQTFQHLTNHSSLLNPPLTEPSNLIGSNGSVESIQIYIGQSVPIGTETQNRKSEIDLFQFGGNFESLSREPITFRESLNINREYLYIFKRNGFVYFLVNQQKHFSPENEVRIVRVSEKLYILSISTVEIGGFCLTGFFPFPVHF